MLHPREDEGLTGVVDRSNCEQLVYEGLVFIETDEHFSDPERAFRMLKVGCEQRGFTITHGSKRVCLLCWSDRNSDSLRRLLSVSGILLQPC